MSKMCRYTDYAGEVVSLAVDHGGGPARRPVLEFRPNGRRTYLWIGNDEDGSAFCLGTVNGSELRPFLAAFLEALDGPPPRKRRSRDA